MARRWGTSDAAADADAAGGGYAAAEAAAAAMALGGRGDGAVALAIQGCRRADWMEHGGREEKVGPWSVVVAAGWQSPTGTDSAVEVDWWRFGGQT